MRILKLAAAIVGAMALVLPSATAVAAAPKKAHASYGKPSGHAKSSVNRPKPGAGQQVNRAGNQPVNRSNQTRNAQKKGGNNVVAGNTVVVNKGNNQSRGYPGNGYYDNGNYHGNNWDDDDDDFLEFVGKTAAVTAGASVVAAVIGSSTKDKPDDCQPVNANGISYMYCNGTYYQASGPSSGPTYTVVAPPQQ